MKENKKQRLNIEEIIRQQIFMIRGKKVMLDTDLAELYGTTSKRLNERVKRNLERFPDDFMFQLSEEEYHFLRSQSATSYVGRGGRRYMPYVFTEHGATMLSSVLNSKEAIQMNLFIIRAFIKMRESLENYKDLALKVREIETRQNHDHALLTNIHSVVKHLLQKPAKTKRSIGFKTD